MITLPYGGLMAAWFVAASSLVLLAYLLISRRTNRVDQRLGDLAGAGDIESGQTIAAFAQTQVASAPATAQTQIDRWTSRRVRQEEKKDKFKERMTQAGFYKPRAAVFFLLLRIALMSTPTVVGIVVARIGIITISQAVIFGILAGLAGTLAPTFWLDHVKRARQTRIRRALPDALDVMVICLEGGLSLAGSFARVARELATAHPMLAVEFNIVERQIQMGRTTGEAVRGLADRFDLEELRSMSSVIAQAERVGSSVVTALKVFADTLRQKRHQHAEELAHKATVKLLFPTIFFIFPGIFVVVLGPAAIQIYNELLTGALR